MFFVIEDFDSFSSPIYAFEEAVRLDTAQEVLDYVQRESDHRGVHVTDFVAFERKNILSRASFA